MKKILAALLLSGMLCTAALASETPMGMIFKEVKQPGGGSGSVGISRVGSATCKSYFGIVALGDCSIRSAMRNGKISALSHYDEEVLNILGYKQIIVHAYGQ